MRLQLRFAQAGLSAMMFVLSNVLVVTAGTDDRTTCGIHVGDGVCWSDQYSFRLAWDKNRWQFCTEGCVDDSTLMLYPDWFANGCQVALHTPFSFDAGATPVATVLIGVMRINGQHSGQDALKFLEEQAEQGDERIDADPRLPPAYKEHPQTTIEYRDLWNSRVRVERTPELVTYSYTNNGLLYSIVLAAVRTDVNDLERAIEMGFRINDAN